MNERPNQSYQKAFRPFPRAICQENRKTTGFISNVESGRSGLSDIDQTISCVVTSTMEKGNIVGETSTIVQKADGPAAPNDLTIVPASAAGASDGKIRGVNAAMEYASKADFGDAKAVSGTEITGLKAGAYYVRVAETDTVKAGASVMVVVESETLLEITGQPESVTVANGTKAEFKVIASGDGLSYKWYYRNPNNTGANFKQSSNTTDTYTIKASETSHSQGFYVYCVVSDSHGNEVTSETAKLTVSITYLAPGKPEWSSDGSYSAYITDTRELFYKMRLYKDGKSQRNWTFGKMKGERTYIDSFPKSCITESGVYTVKIFAYESAEYQNCVAESEMSDAFVYTLPEQKLEAPGNLRWSRESDEKFAVASCDTVEGADCYHFNLYIDGEYSMGRTKGKQPEADFSDRVTDTNAHEYTFTVDVIPQDITVYARSDESVQSAVYDPAQLEQ